MRETERTMKTTSKISRMAAIAAGLTMAASAQATVLTFDLNFPIDGFGDFPAAYGDFVNAANDGLGSYGLGNGYTPNVSVDYRTWKISTNSVVFNHLDFWPTGFGGLTNVVYGVNGVDHFAELKLVPQAGFAVRLNSFDLAGYNQANHPNAQVRILDGVTNAVLVDYSPVTVLGSGGAISTFTPNLTHAGPISIRFGYDNWNIAIDNVNFDQITAVPEPEAYALMLAGLGLVGWAARRRKAPC